MIAMSLQGIRGGVGTSTTLAALGFALSALGQKVLVVCHGGVIKRLLAQARGLPREQLLSVAVPHGALLHVQVSAEGELREVSA